MSIAGHLVGVTSDQLGAELTADLAISDTVVQVDSTVFFDETDGGSIIVGGAVLAYQAYDDPEDEDADDDGPTSLTLTAPSTVAASAGDRVFAYDPTTGADDAVTEHVALVTIDDRDAGDALPARIRTGLVEQLVSDFETFLGKAVELDVIDGELVLVDVLGSKPTGAVKFMQDSTTAPGSGGSVTLNLTYVPITNSEHLYWNGVYQPGSQWSRHRWTVTIPDASGYFASGDDLSMEYAYRDPATKPPLAYSGPTWDAHAGTWSSYPTSFLTSQALPTGTQVGDLLVAVAVGEGDHTIGDSRMTTIATDAGMSIAIGYATTLSPLSCHVGGINFPIDQFAGLEILAVRGAGDGVAYDPTKIAVSDVGAHVALGTISGAGHGAILAIASGVLNGISIDMATYCPAYTDYGGQAHTAVLGNFGYSSSNSPAAQSSPTNTTTLAAVIGLL